MRIVKGLLIMGFLSFLSACSGASLSDYQGSEPKMSVQEYFTGPIKAWGIIQDRSGKVTRRFGIDMEGSWNGDEGTLKELFHYYDGQKQRREWRITKLPDGGYTGAADDVPAGAIGREVGSAVRWAYVMELPVNGQTFRIKFDDWMFLMNDGVLINRSYLKKFGFKVAELTIFMQKQSK